MRFPGPGTLAPVRWGLLSAAGVSTVGIAYSSARGQLSERPAKVTRPEEPELWAAASAPKPPSGAGIGEHAWLPRARPRFWGLRSEPAFERFRISPHSKLEAAPHSSRGRRSGVGGQRRALAPGVCFQRRFWPACTCHLSRSHVLWSHPQLPQFLLKLERESGDLGREPSQRVPGLG